MKKLFLILTMTFSLMSLENLFAPNTSTRASSVPPRVSQMVRQGHPKKSVCCKCMEGKDILYSLCGDPLHLVCKTCAIQVFLVSCNADGCSFCGKDFTPQIANLATDFACPVFSAIRKSALNPSRGSRINVEITHKINILENQIRQAEGLDPEQEIVLAEDSAVSLESPERTMLRTLKDLNRLFSPYKGWVEARLRLDGLGNIFIATKHRHTSGPFFDIEFIKEVPVSYEYVRTLLSHANSLIAASAAGGGPAAGGPAAGSSAAAAPDSAV